MEKRQRFTAKFKREAVRLMRTSGTYALAARINAHLQHRIDSPGPSSVPALIVCGSGAPHRAHSGTANYMPRS